MTSSTEVTKKKPKKKVDYAVAGVSKWVFYPSVAILVLFVLSAIVFPEQFESAISTVSSQIVGSFSWYYVLVATGCVIFALVVAFSKFGDLKLGKEDEEPEYSTISWFAMLFAAGMGIGLVFYGAAEPLSHFVTPPPGTTTNDAEHARLAIGTSFLHWGMHPWAIYAIVGLSIAWAGFRRGRPMSIRWTLEPVLGEKRVKGHFGDLVDAVAVIGTVLGISTSLGLGVNQVAAGIEYLTGFHATKTILIILVIIISSLAALSVASGLDAGIKFLSNTNLVVAALLAFAVAALGPTTFLLNEFVQDLGTYFGNLINMSFRTFPFQGIKGTEWLASWTTYYWGWWMAWSSFVGVFIARISRGRTVREFIIGTIAAPTLVTFVWFAIMGGNALYQQMFRDVTFAGADGKIDANTAFFQSLENLPASQLLCGVAIIVIVIFFVTSSDSGSYVISMLSTAGNPDPSLWVRLTWAAMTGAVTAAVLSSSSSDIGLAALQSLSIMGALPFSLVIIGMAISVWRNLGQTKKQMDKQDRRIRHAMLVQAVSEEVTENITSTSTDKSHRPKPITVAPEVRRYMKSFRAQRRKK